MEPAGSTGGGGFGRDVLRLAVVRVVGVGAAFLTSVLAARLLGPAEFGIGGVAFTLATIVALVANGGLTMSTIFLMQRRVDRQRSLVDALSGLGLLAFAASAVFGVIAAVAVGRLGVPGLIGATVLATGVVAAATVAIELAGAQLLGIGASRAFAVTEAIRSVGILAASAAIMLVVGTAAGYLAGMAIGLLIAAVYALWVAATRIGRPRPRVDVGLWSEALRFGLRGQVGNVLQYFTLRLDLLIVAAILGAVPAGIYLVATRVSEVVTQIANAAATFLFPTVAGRGAAADPAFTATVVRRVTVLVGAAALIIGIGSFWLLPIIFGPTYAEALPALWWLLLAAIPLSIGRLIQGDLKGRGRPGTVSLAAALGIGLLVGGDLLVIGAWGIVGVAAVSAVAYGANALALAVAFRSITGAPMRTLIARPGDVTDLIRAGRRANQPAVVPPDATVSRTLDEGTPPSGHG